MYRLLSNAIRSYHAWRSGVWYSRSSKRGLILEAFQEHPYEKFGSSATSIENHLKNRKAKAAFRHRLHQNMLLHRTHIASDKEERELRAWEAENLPGHELTAGEEFPEARLLDA